MTVVVGSGNNRNVIITVLVILVAVLAFVALSQHNNEPSTKIGRAMDKMGRGMDDAADELNPERRSTSKKIGDAVKDVGSSIKGQ